MKLFSSLGLPEIGFIILISIIVLGPEQTVKTGKTLGKFMRNIITSNWWLGLQETLTEIKHIPYKLMHEAHLEELAELKKEVEELKNMPNEPKLGLKSLNEIQNELGTSAWRGSFQYQTPPPSQEKSTAPDTEN
ncbi:MAG: hypothetical protein B5M51_07090 [Anaerolinea sp. 4484_236]|nr:MAG: hypothetical protein B5M51_07090 [Anaerolinea sp. 4484_236]RLD10104.1 MAG: hypothetical protein DRI56_03085 [Chloroflexota bacterium]